MLIISSDNGSVVLKNIATGKEKVINNESPRIDHSKDANLYQKGFVKWLPEYWGVERGHCRNLACTDLTSGLFRSVQSHDLNIRKGSLSELVAQGLCV